MSAIKKPLTFDVNTSPAPPVAEPKAPKAEQPKGADDRKQVGARIKADTYRQMKLRAAMQDKTIGDLIEQAIAEFLANHPA